MTTNEIIHHEMNDRQLATVLAALRYWQSRTVLVERADSNLATREDEFAPLSDAEIDRLCEALNHE